MPVFRLSERIAFPPVSMASEGGLIAVGGDLSLERLLLAYRMGIFPWYSDGDPILWWSPDPRLVLYPAELRVSRSLARTMRRGTFRISMDRAFEQVVRSCAEVHRRRVGGTWITEEMTRAYCDLQRAGYAHSVETWSGDLLAGGIYGVSLGRCFFGESMFARLDNASKVALATLVEHIRERSFVFLDCQVRTEHMIGMGAREVPRSLFLRQLEGGLRAPDVKGRWSLYNPHVVG